MSNPTPEDSLWSSILLRDAELKEKDESTVRAELKHGGFPDALIERYLQERVTAR